MRALRLLQLTVAIAALSAGSAFARESVFVDYGVLDRLPPAVPGVLAPHLTPPSMMRHRAVPSAAVPVVGNAPLGVGSSVPPIFDRSDTLYNHVVDAGTDAANAAFQNSSRIAAVGPVPEGVTGATRLGHSVEGTQTAMLSPSYRPTGARSDDAAEPRITWTKPVGEVLFKNDGVEVLDIDQHALAELDQIARQLCAVQQRILLRAFGGTRGDDSTEAHRVALRRGLAIRRYLIARGVSSSLIDVTAVGGATDGGPLDRVDLVLSSG